ncbi:ABC transporter ATP-binding protein [Faecalibacillus faecis]|uniref:ABC transporter ATP-binding protein n=1 Tax=Faecalibacillus faecis TaxID=1982628 RepID=UPI002F936821
MKEKKESTLSKLMHFAGNHKYYVYASCILAAMSAFIALVPFYDMWRILKEVLEVRPNFNEAIHIKSYGWHAVLFALLAMVFYIAALMCSHKAAFRVRTNMSTKMMEHIMKLPLGYVESQGSGKIRKIVMESSAATETFLAHNVPDKVVSKATPVGLLIMMAIFDWRLGLMSLIPAIIAFVLMFTAMMGPKMAEDMKQYQNALETMSSEAVEYVRGVPVVKTFGQTIFSFKRFKEAIDEYEKWTLDYTKSMMKPMVCFTTFANGIFAALIIAACLFVGNQITDQFILNLFFYILITSILTTTLMKVAYAGESQMLVEDALNRMDSIMKVQPLPESKQTQIPNDASIDIENISFTYQGASTKAIDNLNMHIKSGEHVALVGPSGGGKTTISRLAARFYDINQGKITVGGMDVSKVEPEKLLELYSIIFQDVTLFNNTVMENIRIGKKNATDEEVIATAKLAHCDEFVEKMPNQWNTMIGENGSELSGGQRQRIFIARAFLKDAPIILMDEATASLDVDNESLIQESISKLIENKTVLVIAHRMRTVDGVDKIVVLKEGVVAEQGKPQELKQQKGIYKHMVDMQMQSNAWKYQ